MTLTEIESWRTTLLAIMDKCNHEAMNDLCDAACIGASVMPRPKRPALGESALLFIAAVKNSSHPSNNQPPMVALAPGWHGDREDGLVERLKACAAGAYREPETLQKYCGEAAARIEALEEALRPFADFDTEGFSSEMRAFDDDPNLTMGHFRRAARAINGEE